MEIAVVGNRREFDEFKEKFETLHSCKHFEDHDFLGAANDFDVIFDFSIGDSPENFGNYETGLEPPVFLNTVKMTLAELNAYYPFDETKFFGFNGFQTFINREVLEVTSLSAQPNLNIFEELSTDFQLVDDRVGMVTPRIVSMIINEAHYTVQEGTATAADIDLGMKLGTNYPHGPFEWLDKIGVSDIYELLEALYEDTKEERYKIAAALKKAYLKSERVTQQ